MAKSRKDGTDSFEGLFNGDETPKVSTLQDNVQKTDIADPDIKAPATIPLKRRITETKSKKVQLLIKPSTYQHARNECEDLNVSFNELINTLLESWLETRK